MSKNFIATMPTFTKTGKLVERGAVLSEDELVAKVDPADAEAEAAHNEYEGFVEAPSGVEAKAVVQISSIAPTGPNPTAPQQLPPGAAQTVDGYAINGAVLVGEVTKADADRAETLEAVEGGDQTLITDALAEAEAQAGADIDAIKKAAKAKAKAA